MSNFVHFDAPFRFVNLKSEFSLRYELILIAGHSAECHKLKYNICGFQLTDSSEFVAKVVSTVKQTHFTTHQPTCNISLEAFLRNPLDYSPKIDSCKIHKIKHLAIIAQMLYRSYGIEVQQVDNIENPCIMVVTWHRDNLWLNPTSPYLVQSRKEKFHTDCTLKFGEKLYPVHGAVLAAKSSYFEKMFKSSCDEAKLGATISVVMEAVEEKSVDMLLDYFYTGELDLKEASITRIDDLVNLSSYFALPHLEQLCFEHLCKSVTANNLKEYIALARHYNHKELESALARHMEQEVNAGNFAELIRLGENEKIEDLAHYCAEGIKQLIKKIDYEPSGFGNCTQLGYFAGFINAIIETRSSSLLPLLVDQIRKVLSHPGYGTHLEKLINYLEMTCLYQTKFDWLPESTPNGLIALKNELYQDVLESIKTRGTDLYKDRFNRSLFEVCLAVANDYQLEELKEISSSLLTGANHSDESPSSTVETVRLKEDAG